MTNQEKLEKKFEVKITNVDSPNDAGNVHFRAVLKDWESVSVTFNDAIIFHVQTSSKEVILLMSIPESSI